MKNLFLTSDGQETARTLRARSMGKHFTKMLADTPLFLPKTGVIAGPVTFCRREADSAYPEAARSWEHDNLHFSMNVETLLRLGFTGVRDTARHNAALHEGEEAAYLNVIADCHGAAIDFVGRHAQEAERLSTQAPGAQQERLLCIAETCSHLTQRAPQTFLEAVQLFWFAWNVRGHGTIGRLDQYLNPYYLSDIQGRRISKEEAFCITRELWEGFGRPGRGDTLQNVVLGGQHRDGSDATNELSFLMLDAELAVRSGEPHTSVRVHSGTPSEFLEKVAAVQALGHGQGTLYNDDLLIPSLVAKGVPLASARNYANDGCTELTIDGESRISFTQLEAVKCLEIALFDGEENTRPGTAQGQYILRAETQRDLHTGLELGFKSGDLTKMETFDEFYDAFLLQDFHQLELAMDRLSRDIRRETQEGVTSPFLAGTFPECLATGVDGFRGALPVPCHIVFAGSLPTVADGLAAVKNVVFLDHLCKPADLLDALRVNWEGHEALRQSCLAAPKFGNDDDFVDEIAADIARRFCGRVVDYPTPTGKPFWPALYNFLFNDETKVVGATPDGRRWNEPMSEHYSPTPGRARKGPTALVRSAVKGPLGDACGLSVFHISLSRSIVPNDKRGIALLSQLNSTALRLGAAVMNVAIYDVDALRAAQAAPELYQDLIVRVWGFSARFVDLSDDMQNHIIARVSQAGP